MKFSLPFSSGSGNAGLFLTTSLSINGYTVVLFLDIKGVFDNVDPGILCIILRDLDLPWNVCKFIYNLTFNRSVFFKIFGETYGPFCSFLGLLQGCILSLLLYTIYTLLIRNYIHAKCNYLCFANDIALHVTSGNLQDSLNIIEFSLRDLSTYLLSLGLSVAPKKTKLVVFSRKRFDFSDLSISRNCTTIKASPSATFLGVLFHYKLS